MWAFNGGNSFGFKDAWKSDLLMGRSLGVAESEGTLEKREITSAKEKAEEYMLLDLNLTASLRARLLTTVVFSRSFWRVHSGVWRLFGKWSPWQLAQNAVESDDEKNRAIVGKIAPPEHRTVTGVLPGQNNWVWPKAFTVLNLRTNVAVDFQSDYVFRYWAR